MLRNKKAQSINEYAIIIGLVAVAIMGMQTYLKRGIQGVIKVSADELGDQFGQFEGVKEEGLVDYQEAFTIDTESDITVTESPPDGINPIRKTDITKDKTKITGKLELLYKAEAWGRFSASEKAKKSGGITPKGELKD
jgi:Flp pilus assembly pilin Flp